MKTLLERAEALLHNAQDWYLGKEKELHLTQAELTVEVARQIEVLRTRITTLEARSKSINSESC